MTKKDSSDSKKLRLDAVLFQAANEGLDSIGASISLAILPYLEKNGVVGPGPIIKDAEAFDKGLRDIFGFGAELIERRILEILCAKLQLSNRIERSFSFPQKIEDLQRIFETKEIQVSMLETMKV